MVMSSTLMMCGAHFTVIVFGFCCQVRKTIKKQQVQKTKKSQKERTADYTGKFTKEIPFDGSGTSVLPGCACVSSDNCSELRVWCVDLPKADPLSLEVAPP